MHKRVSLFVAGFLLASVASSAATAHYTQGMGGQQPPLSPPASTEATINGKRISIKYSAPSMRGRKIMGGLVPYGKVWRTGANAATTLETEANLRIGNLRVPKGTYTLFTVPGENEWTLIINKQTGQSGTNYNQEQDLGRITVKPKQTSAPVERFAITLSPSGKNRGQLVMT